jgi:hypothetical protein
VITHTMPAVKATRRVAARPTPVKYSRSVGGSINQDPPYDVAIFVAFVNFVFQKSSCMFSRT